MTICIRHDCPGLSCQGNGEGCPRQGLVRYLSAETLDQDDFGDPFSHKLGEVVWDAKTQMGPWATMTEKSFNMNAHRHVRHNGGAQGWGQKYVRQSNGELHKVEG